MLEYPLESGLRIYNRTPCERFLDNKSYIIFTAVIYEVKRGPGFFKIAERTLYGVELPGFCGSPRPLR